MKEQERNQPPQIYEDPNNINNIPQLRRQGTSLIPQQVNARIAYQTYFCLLGSVLLALSALSYYLYSDALDHYEYILENWQQQPISSIRLAFDSCQQNEANLINYKWPGTVDGCDCRYRRVLTEYQGRDHHLFIPRNKIYNNHACNITQLAYGCVSVYAQSPQIFDKFPSPKNEGFLLCAILEQDNSFYSHLPEEEQCPDGKRKCGDQNDHFYCTLEKECPVFDIGFQGTNQIQNPIQQTERSLTLLYNRNNNNKLPLAEVRVTEGEGVCMKNHIRGITNGRVEYSLMRENKTECEIDLRFVNIQSTNEVDFYLANDKMWLSNKLRGYEISKEYNWGLYARSYIDWKMECRGEIFDNFIDQQSILENILITQRNLLAVSIIFFVIISCGLSYIQCETIQGRDWECIKGKGTEESNIIFYFEIAIKVVLQSIDAIMIIISFEAVKTEIDFLNNIIKMNCSDEYVQYQLSNLKDILIEEIYQFNIAQLILFILTTILDISMAIMLTISYFKILRQKRQQQNQIEMQAVPYNNQFDYSQQQNPYNS